ncbi:MAG TPA: hypothetical protein VMH37_07415 [Candidatus Binataceae bacterium]|nr:hypothetical protein [Candidatus Binataceae bacterium]
MAVLLLSVRAVKWPMRSSTLNNFVREMIGDDTTMVANSSAIYADRIGRLIRSDYRAVLRRLLKPTEVRDLIAAGRRIAWPLLNRARFNEGSIRSWTRHSASRGITLVLGQQEASKTLLGFYLPKTAEFGRPLIWLDGTVKRRVILGATFVHETGHHIAREVLRDKRGVRRGCADDSDRLDNRDEIAADLFVSIGMIPRRSAVALFRTPDNGLARLRRAYRRICERYSIPFDPRDRDDEDLTCVIGSLHYVKLREALLSEFGV